MKELKYLQFPLCLVKETYVDPVNGINLMIGYGIINYALKQQYELRDVARQLVYDWYRDRDSLDINTRKLLGKAIDAEEFNEDEDYNGFDGNTFQPDGNIEEMLALFGKHSSLRDKAIFSYQLHTACQFSNIDKHVTGGAYAQYLEATSIKEAFEAIYGPDAMPNCKTTILFDFRDNPAEIDLLRAFIGCSSIIGHRDFTGTHKTVILSRMIGAKSKVVLEVMLDETTIPTFELYSSRYRFDKLLDELAARKFIQVLTPMYGRTIFISKFMEPMELVGKIKKARELKDARDMKQRRIKAARNL